MKRPADLQEVTRAALARTIMRLLIVLTFGTLALIAFQHYLGVTPEALNGWNELLSRMYSLALLAFCFYFIRRR